MKVVLSIVLLFLSLASSSQDVVITSLADLPEPLTNFAIASAVVDGKDYMYTFGGISDISSCGQNHLRSYKYSVAENIWSSIDDLPDPIGGMIAAGASTIGNQIYIVGGYHVRSDCSEITSPQLTAFDPVTETYSILSEVPVPVDDHVQLVYKDSLLYLITGWSNTTNVTNVQIYNPKNDTWSEGIPIPHSSKWRVFGGSGSIVDDTIYYSGGAGVTCNIGLCFPPTTYFRKGAINPDNPNSIEWSGFPDDNAIGYRMAASTFESRPIWFGGADQTYNFDAIDYSTGEVVQANESIKWYSPSNGKISVLESAFPSRMDFRGLVKLAEDEYIFAGGIGRDQEVLSSVIKLKISKLTNITTPELGVQMRIHPNPSFDLIFLDKVFVGYNASILNDLGQVVLREEYTPEGIGIYQLEFGHYQICIQNEVLNCASFIKY